MKRCVINVATGAWYPRGQERLVNSLKTVGWDGDILAFTDEQSVDAPSHKISPYAFKPFALQRAVNRGYDLVLWADASCWAVRPIAPMFEHLQQHGHLFFLNCNTGNWSSDASLRSFGLTRGESFDIPMLMGICMGWDMTRPICQEFLKRWLEKAQDGVTFPGSWTNHHHEVSSDPRVYGHRHDQTAASIIAWKLDMPLVVPHETYFQYYINPTGTAHSENPDMSMVREHVVMVAQGL